MLKRKGFTLIELLVVIAIIALLVSILMPALNTAREQAMKTVCATDQKNLSIAWTMYANDNDEIIVGASTYRVNAPYYDWVDKPISNNAPVTEKQAAIRRGRLYPYVNTVEAYHCPGDKRMNTYQHAYRSYSIPGCLDGEGYVYPGHLQKHKLTRIQQPATKYVFIEESDGRGYNMGSWMLPDPSAYGSSWVDPIANYHRDCMNLGWADGHASTRYWVDERTLEIAETQRLWANTPDNPDLQFMQLGWTRWK